MKILIVEDDLLVARYLKSFVESLGADVVGITRCVNDSITFIESNQVDGVIMDLRLADNSNGLDLAKYLANFKIPFIVTSANNDCNMLYELFKTYPIHFIKKPFSKQDIFVGLTQLEATYNKSRTTIS